jgi:transcriptional regulator with XRE-family HTH domain
MDTLTVEQPIHIGRNIKGVRELRGWTQEELGTKLGSTKQAVSKLEQSEDIGEARLISVAEALEVTVEGLRNFNQEKVLTNTANFYEGSHSVNTNISTIINHPIEKIVELYESLLKSEKEKNQILQNRKGK